MPLGFSKKATTLFFDCNRDTTRMIFILFEGTTDVIVYTIDERNTCKLLGGFHVRLIGKHYCYLVIQIRSKSPEREDQTNFPIMVSFGIAYTIFVCLFRVFE